jgi:hypothetical protein
MIEAGVILRSNFHYLSHSMKHLNIQFLKKSFAMLSIAGVATIAQADAQKEVEKQIGNLISAAISSRVSEKNLTEQQSQGSSAYAGITSLILDNFDNSNIFIGGLDEEKEKSISGLAISYAKFGGIDFLGLAPYLAIIHNTNYYTKFQGSLATVSGSGFSSSTIGGGASYNFIEKTDSSILKAGVGVSASINSSDDDVSFAASADAEYGFKLGPKNWLSFGITANQGDKSKTFSTDGFVSYEVEVQKGVTFGAKVGTALTNNSGVDFDYKTVTATLRIKF